MEEYRCLSYMGYEIEGKDYVNSKELALLNACFWMVDNKETIRKTAENCYFAKSTLHYQIHHSLKYLSPDLYNEVKKQMKKNIKKRRR